MTEINPVAQVMMDDVEAAVEQRTIDANFIPWTSNVGLNLRSGKGRPLAEFTLPEDRKKETIFIVGPGASMSQYRDNLPKLRDVGTIVMQPTAYPWMHEIGLEPDVLMTVDRMDDQPRLLKGSTCPVIAATLAHPKVAEYDPYWFMVYQGNGTKSDPRWGQYNLIMHHLHREALGAHGHTSLGDVTNMAVQMFSDVIRGEAPFENWPAKRIVLVGVDRSYWHGYERLKSFNTGEELPPVGDRASVINFRGVGSATSMVFYMMWLYEWWRMYPEIPLYRLDHGIMREIPFVGLSRILAGKWPKPLSCATIEKRMAKFLEHEYLEKYPYCFGPKEDVDEMMRVSAIKWEVIQEELREKPTKGD